jgi:hypothetical protein
MLHEKHPSCSGWDVKHIFLHDLGVEFHVPRYGSRAQIFSLKGPPNFIAKIFFQWCPIVSTLRDCSGKKIPNKWLGLHRSTHEPLQPLEYLPYDQAKDFLDQIGENTHYTIHPEETLAENFVLWMISSQDPNQLKTPAIVQKMNDIIARAATSIPHLTMVATSNKNE